MLDSPVPDFSLPSTGGSTFSSAEQRGKPLVIYFYPKDNTPGCTTEGQQFRDLYPRFAKLGCTIVGISRDSLKSHESFKAKMSFPFELLSDEAEALKLGRQGRERVLDFYTHQRRVDQPPVRGRVPRSAAQGNRRQHRIEGCSDPWDRGIPHRVSPGGCNWFELHFRHGHRCAPYRPSRRYGAEGTHRGTGCGNWEARRGARNALCGRLREAG